ncbi:hypothetical protein BDV24DRAFT_29556 [Aspergillus arachidicola]|uniref:Uncharacterized protein n=1 Tax=Aspergillus arachidicola TaxID=656916 RepID=A0A5N6YE11_9EURO|nr:hypothetical protein BDV24DRAFT_29556 [Aspergillus arachidicola]
MSEAMRVALGCRYNSEFNRLVNGSDIEMTKNLWCFLGQDDGGWITDRRKETHLMDDVQMGLLGYVIRHRVGFITVSSAVLRYEFRASRDFVYLLPSSALIGPGLESAHIEIFPSEPKSDSVSICSLDISHTDGGTLGRSFSSFLTYSNAILERGSYSISRHDRARF